MAVGEVFGEVDADRVFDHFEQRPDVSVRHKECDRLSGIDQSLEQRLDRSDGVIEKVDGEIDDPGDQLVHEVATSLQKLDQRLEESGQKVLDEVQEVESFRDDRADDLGDALDDVLDDLFESFPQVAEPREDATARFPLLGFDGLLVCRMVDGFSGRTPSITDLGRNRSLVELHPQGLELTNGHVVGVEAQTDVIE